MSYDFTEVTKLKTFRNGDNLGLSDWTQHNYKGPYRREAGSSELDKAGHGNRGPNDVIPAFEDGRGRKTKDMGNL